MGIGVCVPIFDKDGRPTVLKSGRWFCYGCHAERKFIAYPHTGCIAGRCPKCGSVMVYKQD